MPNNSGAIAASFLPAPLFSSLDSAPVVTNDTKADPKSDANVKTALRSGATNIDLTRTFFASTESTFDWGRPGDVIADLLAALSSSLATFSGFIRIKAAEISGGSERARNSQQAATMVDGIISGLEKPTSTGTLSQDLIAYLRNNKISLGVTNGKGIDEWLAGIGKTTGEGLTRGQLETVKGALEADAGRNNDVMGAGNTAMQRIMQTFNAIVTFMSNVLAMNMEMIKNIFSKFH